MIRAFVLVVAVLFGGTPAFAGRLDLAMPSSIRSQFVKIFCAGEYQPYIVANLYINGPDMGRPGLVYVAMHDAAETRGIFHTQGGGTSEYGAEAMYPPYSVESGGLRDVSITLPVGPIDWKLFVGYGALSAKDEATVQSAQEAIERMRAMGKKAPPLDPNHHRRSFIQNDLETKGKYSYVLTWTSEQAHSCDPLRP